MHLKLCTNLYMYQYLLCTTPTLSLKNKRPTCLNSHLSIRDSTLTSCQKGSYFHIYRPIIEHIKINNGRLIHVMKIIYNLTPHYWVMKLKFWYSLPWFLYYRYILSLSDLCPGVEMKTFQEIMYLDYIYTGVHIIRTLFG